ncbi:MAG: universal stress protein [Acidimicrobiales bacterium]
MEPLAVVSVDRDGHATPEWHPEAPDRVPSAAAGIADAGLDAGTVRLEARLATLDELACAHSELYLDALRRFCAASGGEIYVSIHQSPLYPGTGRADETGGPAAPCTTVNLPLPQGTTGDTVRALLDEIVSPVVERFAPTWLLVHALGMLEGAHRVEVIARFEDWLAPLAAVPHRGLAVDGGPVTVLLEAAERENADLVVVGSRGVGGHPDLLLGSTSHQVIQLSRRPVVVVPPSWSVAGHDQLPTVSPP